MAERPDTPGKFDDDEDRKRQDKEDIIRTRDRIRKHMIDRYGESTKWWKDDDEKKKDKPEPFKPYEPPSKTQYQAEKQYKSSLPRFSPERIYKSEMVDSPEIRNKQIEKDYRFVVRKIERKESFNQRMIGIRNIKAYIISNTVEFGKEVDIFRSGVLDDPNITLDHRIIRSRGYDRHLVTLNFEGSPVAVMLGVAEVRTIPDTYDVKSRFKDFKKYVGDRFNLAPNLSTFQGQCQQEVLNYDDEPSTSELAGVSSDLWSLGGFLKSGFTKVADTTLKLGTRGLDVLMRDPSFDKKTIAYLEADVKASTQIEASLQEMKVNLELRDMMSQTDRVVYTSQESQASVDKTHQESQTPVDYRDTKIKSIESDIETYNSEILKLATEREVLEKKLQNVKSKSLGKGLYIYCPTRS